jgi:hypothetical protein
MLHSLDELCAQFARSFKSDGSLRKDEWCLQLYDGCDWTQRKYNGPEPFHKESLFRNEHFEVVLICWKKGYETAFHEHPAYGCLLRVLEGKLEETIDRCFDGNFDVHSIDASTNVSYMHNSIGLHKVRAVADSCSLHIYAPPGFYEHV